jgi:hypothetical protein
LESGDNVLAANSSIEEHFILRWEEKRCTKADVAAHTRSLCLNTTPLSLVACGVATSGCCSQRQERNVEMGSKGVTLTQAPKNNSAHFLLSRA